MNKNYGLNKIVTVKGKASLVTIPSRIKTVRVLLLLLPLLLLLSMEMFKHKLISNVETIWDKVFKNGQRKICGRQLILEYLSHLLPYENTSLKKTTVTVGRRKENKQICSKTSLQMKKIKMFI